MQGEEPPAPSPPTAQERPGQSEPTAKTAGEIGSQSRDPLKAAPRRRSSPISRLGSRARRLFARTWPDALFLLFAGVLYYWIVRDAFTTRIVTMAQGSDYWEHSATLQALIQDPWHPKNPHLVSAASSPRFGPLFVLSALVARTLELDAPGAMGVATATHTLLLLAGIFFFFRTYFRDARASFYGLIVMFASWWSAWHFSNVYQLKIFFSVASYPSTGALGLSLLGFTLSLYVLRRKLGQRSGFFCLSLLWAGTLITHPLTAMLGFAGNVALAISQSGVPLGRRLLVGASPFLGVLLAELWPYFSTYRVLAGGSQDDVAQFGQALSSALDDEASMSRHLFYRRDGLVNTLGYALVGIPICLYLLLRRRHLFIPLGALAMAFPFIVNAYVPLPLGHRFILLTVFFLQVAVVWLLMKLTRGSPEAIPCLTRGFRGFISGIVVAALLYEAALPNVYAAMGRYGAAERRLRGRESPNLAYARQVGALAGPDAVVMAEARSAWPLPTFGPKIVSLFHTNPLVPDQPERAAWVRRFFSPRSNDRERLAIIRLYGVTHVLVNRRLERVVANFLRTRSTRHRLPAGYVLYPLNPANRGR